MTQQQAARTYADHVLAYAEAGWPCILPVPPATKTPPPVGFTGAEGRDTDPLTLVQLAGDMPHHSIALRMPDGVIGIDVDQYVKHGTQKHGAETLAAFVERWGPLPATWTSTAREPDGPSRIHLFRVPAQRYGTKLGTGATGDIEIIQRHHRYAVVWPSPHESGGIYTWYAPTGRPSARPPRPQELAELPAAWVEGLAATAATAAAASSDVYSGEALLAQLRDDWRTECAEVTSARLTALDSLSRADSGSRHDAMTERTHHLVQLAASGHTGVAHALLAVAEAWSGITAGEDRADELARALLSSARKAVTTHGAVQAPRDPCSLAVPGTHAFLVHGAVPDDDRPDDPDNVPVEGIDPGRFYSVREAIGTHAFDPNAGLDQTLAEEVLARMYPALRYAYDTGSWLLRVPDRWEERPDLGGWAVAQLAPLMPLGDPTAEKGTEPHERAARRTRLMSTPGAKAIAGKIGHLVIGGTHPASVKLGALDSDPNVLWAGGMPYSLRLSHDGPTFANLDPSTPHLHSAGVMPERMPTPLWDAFLAAVWPDPELRAWAVRVLAISLTGYADRAMPILLGETGRGKTQVVHLLMSVLGSYAHAANPKLLNSASNEHDTILYALKGRRLSFIDEAPSESRTGQERLKQITGGSPLTARQMNRDPITFSPTHTLILTANPESEPVLTDPAIRSRTRLIPCEGDPQAVLSARAAIGHVAGLAWRTEAPGVLATMMAEAAAWLADPSTAGVAAAPENVRYVAERLGAEQDPVSVWVTEETEPYDVGTPSRELYQAFTASCMRNNLRRDAVPSETKWGRLLTRMGYPSRPDGRHKIRNLRVSTGGFLPGMPALPGSGVTTRQTSELPGAGFSTAPSTTAGFAPETAGFLPGSTPNPAAVFPQVNPSESVATAGFAGFEEGIAPHVHARDHAHARREADLEIPLNPAVSPSTDPVGEAPEKPARKPAKPRSAEATAKAAQLREEKRRAAIAEAAGPMLDLPAVVTRDGSVVPADVATVDALLSTITSSGAALTVDVEHSGYPLGHEHYVLRTVQLGNEQLAVVLDPADPVQADVVRRHLSAASQLHAHSATADLVPLATADLIDAASGWARMLDTGILAKLADPASTGNDADLKSLSKAVLGPYALSPAADEARSALFKAGKWLTETKVTTPVEKSGWAQVGPHAGRHSTTMTRYAASDVLDDAAIARRLPDPGPLLERERAVQRMTARVSHHGIRINGEHVDRLLAEHTQARAEHGDQVRALSGGGIENPGSDAQVGQTLTQLGALLPRTKTGKPSVAAGVLKPLSAQDTPAGALAREVLTYRHHDTALGLFLEPYHELVHRGDGRARPTVYTLGADTGRMSCVRPNVQQMPRTGGFRACFTADPGQLLISADFSQVELRVAAALSGDTELARVLADPDRDVHMEVARLAFGPDAGKPQRYLAKPMVFGRLYGSGAASLARDNGVSEGVAKQVLDALDRLAPQLAAWSAERRYAVEMGHTQFPAYSGRIIHMAGIRNRAYAATNYAIQGTARELLVDALLRWAETPWGGAVLFPVHDEVVAMVPEDQAEAATTALVQCMTTELYGIPIVAEPSTPTYSWSDAA